MQLNVAVLRRNVLRHRAAGAIYRWPDPWGEMGGSIYTMRQAASTSNPQPQKFVYTLQPIVQPVVQPAVMCKHRTTLNYATPNSRATVCVCVC